MKNCNILGVRAKIRFLRGGGSQKKTKSQYLGEDYLESGVDAREICRLKSGAWQ